MNLEQLKTLLNDATGVIRMGTGAGEILRYRLDDMEFVPETTLISVYDKDDCVEFAFTCEALMNGTVSEDGIYLYVKDTRGRDQELKFNRKGYMNLKPYIGLETQEIVEPIVHTIYYDIDNEGSDVEVYGDDRAAWRRAAELAVDNASEAIRAEVEKLRDLCEYEKCVERWQKDVDASGFGSICVGYQLVKGGVTIPRQDVYVQQSEDVVVITPAAGKWLDVTQQIPEQIVIRMKVSSR